MSSKPRFVKLDELRQHCTADDAWVAINGNVYDVTDWHLDHPGGSELLVEYAGKDATKLFEAVQHSDDAIATRETFLVGSLSAADATAAAEEALAFAHCTCGEAHTETAHREATQIFSPSLSGPVCLPACICACLLVDLCVY